MVDQIILCYFPQQHFTKWLGMTCNNITYEVKKKYFKKRNRNKILLTHKNVFMLPIRLTDSYTEDEPNFPWWNNIIL